MALVTASRAEARVGLAITAITAARVVTTITTVMVALAVAVAPMVVPVVPAVVPTVVPTTLMAALMRIPTTLAATRMAALMRIPTTLAATHMAALMRIPTTLAATHMAVLLLIPAPMAVPLPIPAPIAPRNMVTQMGTAVPTMLARVLIPAPVTWVKVDPEVPATTIIITTITTPCKAVPPAPVTVDRTQTRMAAPATNVIVNVSGCLCAQPCERSDVYCLGNALSYHQIIV